MAPVSDQTALRHEKAKTVGILSSVIWNVLSLSERSRGRFVTESYRSGMVRRGRQRQTSATRNIRETQPILSIRITIVTMS